MNHYGKKLNPNRRLKTPKAIKGERREVSITNNPSTIAANQKLSFLSWAPTTRSCPVPRNSLLKWTWKVAWTTIAVCTTTWLVIWSKKST